MAKKKNDQHPNPGNPADEPANQPPQAGPLSLGEQAAPGSTSKSPETPSDENVKESSVDSPVEPTPIEEIRRTLKEDDKPEETRPLIPGVMNWIRSTLSNVGSKGSDAAGIEARLDDESISLHSQPEFDMPHTESKPVAGPVGEAKKQLANTREAEKAKVEAVASTGIPGAAEPALGNNLSAIQSSLIKPPTIDSKIGYDLSPKTNGGEKTSLSYEDIREAALQGFEEPPAEPERGSLLGLRHSLKQTLKEMRPSDKRLLAAACIVLILILLLVAAYAVVNSRPPKPLPTSTPTLGISFPAAITFPGGWDFSLAIGRLQDNKWSPQSAEWLEGTEISRWVSLPYSLQLEAVFQSLKPGDVLELIMTNTDHLPFTVQSVQKRSGDQFAGIDKQVPGLVVFLTNPGSNETWVILANP